MKKIILILSIFLLFGSFVVAEDLNEQCSGIKMVWRDNNIIDREDSYNYINDICNGYRCLKSNEISPSCYNLEQCKKACNGTCVDIYAQKRICSGETEVIEKEAQKVDDNEWFFEVDSKVELFGKTITLLDVYEDGTVVVQVGKPTAIVFSQQSRTVPSSTPGDADYSEEDVFYIKVKNEESFYAPEKSDRAATLKISQGDESEIETFEDGEETPERIIECNGCLDENNNCIPYSIRIGNKFCDINKEMKLQLSHGEYCNNNYECDSNVCVSNECISTSFLEKIIEWFKKIFG